MPEQETPRVDRLAIIAIAVEMVFFGSMHFTFDKLTKEQIPGWITSDSIKSFIVVVTGMIEVTAGILILLPKTRKWAAQVTFVLLILFLPAIYNMLAHDEANPVTGAWLNLWRVLLVPNHVFLALCAIHLWRSEGTAKIGPAQVVEGILTSRREPTSGAATLIVAWVMLLANVAGFLVIWASPWLRTTANLWAMMCLATGALVGFLFGIPRINSEAVQSSTHSPNSNIVVVSDWLTKIIVGVGLVEFRNIGAFLSEVSAELGKALSPQPSPQTEVEAASFAQALIVYFFIAGIIQGYLLTRMYLTEKFKDLESPRLPTEDTKADDSSATT